MKFIPTAFILSSLVVASSGQGTTTTTSTTVTSTTTATSTVTTTATSPPAPLYTTTVSYDTRYDNANGSLRTVACSDGDNGFLTSGYDTFGSLPRFPLIGGAFSIPSWNSPNCGSCWELAYTRTGAGNVTTTTRVNILAIDVAVNSFNVALGALNQLTGGRGVELGRVPVVARELPASACGLPA